MAFFFENKMHIIKVLSTILLKWDDNNFKPKEIMQMHSNKVLK